MVLISSFSDRVSSQFIGFCWADANLVVGEQGATEYEKATGEKIRPGLDGCYCVVTRHENNIQMGVDSRGLFQLFVYQSGTDWAISSSFYQLVQHLRKNSAKLTPRMGVLAAFGIPRSFTDQLATSRTVFEEINLLPSFSVVEIEDTGIKVFDRPVRTGSDYENDLAEYIATWRSRLATITSSSGSEFHVDLSGGIDSRTVLAFALADKNFNTKLPQFTVVSSIKKVDDYKAASTIADKYDLILQPGRHRNRKKLSQDEAFHSWLDDSLGVYLPVYLHAGFLDPTSIHGHGAGGENFRRYYQGVSVLDQVKRAKAHLEPKLYQEWLEIAIEDAQRIGERRPHIDPLTLHYREFRNRFHFGHAPKHQLMFSPLESGMTDWLTDFRGSAPSGQLYYDIMESLAPGLKDLPFDSLDKAPQEEHKRSLTIVDLQDPVAGEIFGGPLTGDSSGKIKDAYETWLAEGAQLLQRQSVKSFLSEEKIEEAYSPVQKYKENNIRLSSHDKQLISLSYAYSVAFTLEE